MLGKSLAPHLEVSERLVPPFLLERIDDVVLQAVDFFFTALPEYTGILLEIRAHRCQGRRS